MDKTRVLIVDDEQVICDLLSDDLYELGYSCEVALDGNCALQKMAKDKFDITLLDIKLPEISGIEILKEITSKYNSAVIMITAIDDVNTAVESMKLGALDYIVKPFNLSMLDLRINAALKKHTKSTIKVNSNIVTNTDDEKELQEMDAIASGIEIKLDLTDKRSTTVTLKTIMTAREIGIPDERIIQWVLKRAEVNKNNLKLLKKFKESIIAQTKMGIAPEYRIDTDSHEFKN
jgi:DNA-binding response OmpR family regulator